MGVLKIFSNTNGENSSSWMKLEEDTVNNDGALKLAGHTIQLSTNTGGTTWGTSVMTLTSGGVVDIAGDIEFGSNNFRLDSTSWYNGNITHTGTGDSTFSIHGNDNGGATKVDFHIDGEGYKFGGGDWASLSDKRLKKIFLLLEMRLKQLKPFKAFILNGLILKSMAATGFQ